LENCPREFDYVHLSNILDWLTPEAARGVLGRAWSALRPGGWVMVRQLNSSLDIRALGDWFDWHRDEAAALHARDRSYFYRDLHLGRAVP
jgi:S-adenosylmethionine-diacylglycerol 3-amino-3-carboxypropyl transferase